MKRLGVVLLLAVVVSLSIACQPCIWTIQGKPDCTRDFVILIGCNRGIEPLSIEEIEIRTEVGGTVLWSLRELDRGTCKIVGFNYGVVPEGMIQTFPEDNVPPRKLQQGDFVSVSVEDVSGIPRPYTFKYDEGVFVRYTRNSKNELVPAPERRKEERIIATFQRRVEGTPNRNTQQTREQAARR